MISLFSRPQQKQEDNKIYTLLNEFYNSFAKNNTFNEMNIEKYRNVRDAAGLVMRKFEKHDHPLAYTNKLVMYIDAQVALKNLHLTHEQRKIMQVLREDTKYTNLCYVYTSPINNSDQFEV